MLAELAADLLALRERLGKWANKPEQVLEILPQLRAALGTHVPRRCLLKVAAAVDVGEDNPGHQVRVPEELTASQLHGSPRREGTVLQVAVDLIGQRAESQINR